MRTLLTVALTFLRRDALVARAYPLPLALQVAASGGILLVIHRIGTLVDAGRSEDRALQAGYFSYVLVGVLVLQVVTSMVVAFASKLREEQTTGTLEAVLSTPAPTAVVAVCLPVYQLLQSVVVCTLLLLAGLASGANFEVTAPSALAAVVAGVGLVCLAGACGLLVGAFVVVFRRGGGIAGWIVSLVAFCSGIYFPVAQLPAVLEPVGQVLPSSWGITALRSALLLGEVDTVRTVAVVVGGVVLLGVSTVVFARSVELARRRGTLGQY